MIYYSHVNEDNQVEQQAFAAGSFSRLFCVAGSGERVLALLDSKDLRDVFIIDPNEEALFLIELKLQALSQLDIDQYLNFIGFGGQQAESPEAVYRQLSGKLSAACRIFWDKHPDLIRRGILHIGYFERFLQRTRPLLRLWLGKSFYRQFEASSLPLRGLPDFRWRVLKWCFAQNITYRLFGNHDIAFVGQKADLKKIPEGIDRSLRSRTFRQSFMNHLIFRGNLSAMPEEERPVSLNRDHLRRVKERLPAINFHFLQNDLLSTLRELDETSLGNAFYSLSDLLSFEDHDYIRQILSVLQRSGMGPKQVLLRAFVRHRLERTQINSILEPFGTVSESSSQEKTGMYQVFDIGFFSQKQVLT